MGSTSVELSVVIPVHNAAAELSHLLDSLVAQDYPGDWEVVIADNGSTDGSRDVVGEYRDRFERLSLVDSLSVRRVCACAQRWGP